MTVILQGSAQAGPDIYERVLLRTTLKAGKLECDFTDCTSILLPGFVASFLRAGDVLLFRIDAAAEDGSVEVYVRKPNLRAHGQDILLVEIGYAQQPASDGRNGPAVNAEVLGQRLGIKTVQLPCDALRDHFYVVDRRESWDRQTSFYELLHVDANASPTELRIAFRLRSLEQHVSNAPSDSRRSLERAFNILAQPELRACYDTVLRDPTVPVAFPYAGFGHLLVSGSVSRDGQMFYASRILSFRPRQSVKTIQAALRHCTFYDHFALFRDSHRKLEVCLDRAVMPLPWDGSWNRWKHLLGARVGIKAVFIQTGRYRYRKEAWELRLWEKALPSRIEVALPEDISRQIGETQKNYQRFGQFVEPLKEIRSRLESVPVEREELRRLCSRLGIPGDFDVALITWKPDYEDFYYKQLCRRARYLYLFRAEYIFDLETVVAVETPQLGHATYLFSKPGSMADFLTFYRAIAREDILQNRNNVAERLGFVCRLIHGQNPQTWLAELRVRLGEIASGRAECEPSP